jgi:hypothetical protein
MCLNFLCAIRISSPKTTFFGNADESLSAHFDEEQKIILLRCFHQLDNIKIENRKVHFS